MSTLAPTGSTPVRRSGTILGHGRPAVAVAAWAVLGVVIVLLAVTVAIRVADSGTARISGEWGGDAWQVQRAGERASLNATAISSSGGWGGVEWQLQRAGERGA